MIEITSYKAAGPVRLGMSQAEVVEVLGDPDSCTRDTRGKTLLQYKGKNISVGPEGVVEIGFVPECPVEIAGVRIFSDADALRKLCRIDGNPKEVLGFVVFMKLGITMTGFHDRDEAQKAVTVFSKGRWDVLQSEMKPLDISGPSGV